MEVKQEYCNLIKELITNNRRFSGNEDLFEIIYDDILSRSTNILTSCDDLNIVKHYINKLVNTAILKAKKNRNALKKQNIALEHNTGFDYSRTPYKLDDNQDIDVDISVLLSFSESNTIKSEEIEEIKEIVLNLDSQNTQKKYYNIFTMLYIEGLNQSDIAKNLSISEYEVSTRLAELLQEISSRLQEKL